MKKKFYMLLCVTLIYAAGMVWASLQAGDQISRLMGPLAVLASLLHIPAYAGLSALMFLTVKAHHRLGACSAIGIAAAVFVFAVAFGVLNEYFQMFSPGRTFSIGDMVNNALGAGAALVVMIWKNKMGNKMGTNKMGTDPIFHNSKNRVRPHFILCAVIFASAFAATAYPDSINARIERLQERYGISFRYKDFPPRSEYLKFVEIPARQYPVLNEYLELFEEEINKYPPGFFKDRDIRGIGLVTRLFAGKTPAQGLYNAQARVMFFDIARFSRNKAQQRHSIHHEIFHMMVQNRGGHPLLSDETWKAFNHPDFLYGKQAKPLSEPNPYNRHAPNQPGFVTYYAMESVTEDQAEVFACLMLEPHRRLIEQWMQKDPYLEKKVQAIKEFVNDYHPEMEQ